MGSNSNATNDDQMWTSNMPNTHVQIDGRDVIMYAALYIAYGKCRPSVLMLQQPL